MAWHIGVDVGGTFTDFYGRDSAGAVRLAKRPSTRDNPGRALLEGLRELAALGVDLGSVQRLAHGTTVATNALIQRRGGRVALLTTRGFRDLLEIGRQIRPHMYDLYQDYPPPVVPRELRFEVDERITAGGRVVRPLAAETVAAAVRAVQDSEAQSCAICLLFAFANAEHEERLADALRAACPEVNLSLSSRVQPEFREYERFSTTALNAYLQPVMDRYMASLEAGLGSLVPNARVGINQSSGGLMSTERTRSFPVRTALSGPAAGVIGAIECARTADSPSFITLDMGGTSADVALVQNLRADIAFDREVAGFPIRLPSVDVHTVGAGGGSVAWFDRDGLIKVGPQSAGADPGPACYGRGGEEPTVTDADLVLGRLSPRGLLDGQMRLAPDRSRAALQPFAERLGYTCERVAHGVLGIVVANMVRAIRTISVERGYDPRDFALVAFGGAGPLHAREVAQALGISEVIVPPAPGIVCAQGLVIAELKEDFVVGERLRLTPQNDVAFAAAAGNLVGQAQQWFDLEQIPPADRGHEIYADARYVGQNFELRIPVISRSEAARSGPPPTLATLRERFLEVHELAYGYANPDDPVETVNIRLTAYGAARSAAPALAPPATPPAPHPAETRPVWFSGDEPVPTPVFARGELSSGLTLEGPAIVEQLDATTVVFPGDRIAVDAAGNLRITLAED